MLEHYLKGASPVRLFRDVGLPPEVIGYKRIERAVSRWKKDKSLILDGEQAEDTAFQPTAESARLRVGLGVDTGNESDAAPASSGDVRDMLIVQQIHRIAELERQVARYKALIGDSDSDEQTLA